MQRTGSADLNFTVGVRTPVDFQATASKVKDADVIVFVGGISPRLEGEEMPVDAKVSGKATARISRSRPYRRRWSKPW